MKRFLIVGCAVLLAAAWQAKADSVDFSNQTGPTTFAAATGPQSITEGLATFNGGTILTDEESTTFAGSVYATCDPALCAGPALLNPITIDFSSPVNDFSLVTINDEAGTYTLTDNLGDKTTVVIASVNLSPVTLSLVDTGATSATLTSSATSDWDFAIESASYNTPTAPTPEPSTWLLLATGIAGLIFFSRKRLLA